MTFEIEYIFNVSEIVLLMEVCLLMVKYIYTFSV